MARLTDPVSQNPLHAVRLRRVLYSMAASKLTLGKPGKAPETAELTEPGALQREGTVATSIQ